MTKIFSWTLYNNTLEDWLIALGVVLVILFSVLLIKRVVKQRLLKMVKKSGTEIDDIIIPLLNQTRWFTIFALGVYFGSLTLNLPSDVKSWVSTGFRVFLFLQVGFWGIGIINYYLSRKVSEKIDQDQGEDATTLDAVGLLMKIALWVIVSVVILDNVGVEVNSLLASLGIGGIAVALAVQNILGDLFSSLSIALDKPFVIGDFVIVDDYAGNVEQIGLKSTRIRSLSGEELVFSNTDLLNSRIRNYKRLQKRRISFKVGVVYGTEVEKLKVIPEIVREVIEPLKEAEFDRAHFHEMGDFSLIYEIVYYVVEPGYEVYMDLQQSINLGLYERFSQEGIEFAFPTQTLVIDQE